MSYTLHIRSEPGGRDLIRTDGRVKSLTMAWDKHGCADLTTMLDIPRRQAFSLYDQAYTPYVLACYYGAPIWAGRLMEPTISGAGARLVSAGYWAAFKDTPYTGLWSNTKFSGFNPLTWRMLGGRTESRYALTANADQLFLSPNKGAAFTNGTDAGALYFQIPDSSQRNIVAVSFDWAEDMPANWTMYSATWAANFTAGATVWSRVATGLGGTGSVNITFTGKAIIEFGIYNSTGALYTNAGETGRYYLAIRNLRIKTTTASTVLGSDIAASVASYADSINPILAASYATASTLDLRDEVYEDQYPADIIDRVAGIDNVRAYVDENRVFWYGGLQAGKWLIDAADLEIQRPLERVYNNVYAIYQDADDRSIRSAAANNAFSISRYGLTRTQAISVQSTSSSQATSQRDTALSDTANPAPRAGITVKRILDPQGRAALAHEPRPGDLAIIPALPPSVSAEADQIRSFIIGRVEVTLEPGKRPMTTIEPNEPIPTLTTMLARIAAT